VVPVLDQRCRRVRAGLQPACAARQRAAAGANAASICGRIAAIGSGVGFVAFSIGVWRESGRRIAVGAICWLVFGISMLTNGLWPMGHPMHGFYTIGIANIIAPAMSHIELSAWSANRRAYAVTAVVSIAGIVYLWLNVVGADPEGFRG
jgi:hypothetical protein